MVNAAADLAQFVQRRELLAYEQRVARAAYAYGVDLRRAAWIEHSTIGEPLMRTVDRRWSGLVEDLSTHVLAPPDRDVPTVLLEELSGLLRLLRAPVPTLRLLRASESDEQWPIVTPIGTTRGGSHWLILDVARLMALEPLARAFVLGSALGNLQCDHGPLFAAHLLAHRGRGLGLIRTLLRPWSRVTVFSADRAGLLSVGELAPALESLEIYGQPTAPWLPRLPSLALRKQGLEDFDHSRVMTRLRLMFPERGDWTVAPAPNEAPPNGEEEPRAGDDTPGAVTGKADMRAKAPPPAQHVTADARKGTAAVPHEDSGDSSTSEDADPVEEAEAAAEQIEREREAAESAAGARDVDQTIADRIARAWPLARCDARLTRRLGLL